jgi:hypothetical protein
MLSLADEAGPGYELPRKKNESPNDRLGKVIGAFFKSS